MGPHYGPIYRNFEAPELEPLLKENGVQKTIVVQAENSLEDTSYMLGVAERYDWIGGVVGWVPLDHPDVAFEQLQELTRNPKFKGVRHLIHEEKDPDWIIQDVVIEGLRVLAAFELTFDVVAVFPYHLRHVPTLVKKVPNLKMVLDHLAKPPIKEKQMEPWKSQLERAADNPRVYAKISGLNTAAEWNTWSADNIKPYISAAVDCFGADRLMFGSDWPIATLAGNYHKVWRETCRALRDYSDSQQLAIFGETARNFYRIE
jgi:L-fuconolactonase